MELPELGQNCHFESCQQLDFLPFLCEACNKVYCLSHKEKATHQCPKLENHKSYEDDGSHVSTKSFSCELKDCSINELVPVLCPDCCKNFCLRHRHPQDHNCEKHQGSVESTLTPKEKVEAVIGRELKNEIKVKEPKSSKASKTAAKVALMKLKMHAIGDKGIPQIDRVYFNVQLPPTNPVKETSGCAMFFNKAWTVGRIIDNISLMKNVNNENNIADAQKLRLFTEDGRCLTSASSLQTLVDNSDINLDSNRILKLKYTDHG